VDELPLLGEAADVEALITSPFTKLGNGEPLQVRVLAALREGDLRLADDDRTLRRHLAGVMECRR
jgi:hypothetical protein